MSQVIHPKHEYVMKPGNVNDVTAARFFEEKC